MFKGLNRFDLYILIIIVSLCGGEIGGALKLARVCSILAVPYVLHHIYCINKLLWFKRTKFFLFFYFFWAVISLLWTPDIIEGIKELFYYLIHINLIFALFLLSIRALSPLKSVALGWFLAVMIMLPFSVYELISDQHLSFISLASKNIAGEVVEWKYASFTFFNYNTYNTVLCMSLPFILYLFGEYIKPKYRIFILCILFCMFSIIVMNSSRGAILSCMIIFIIQFYINYNSLIKNKGVLLLFFGIFAFLIIVLYDTLTYQFFLRLSAKDLFEDTSRASIAAESFKLLSSSGFMGVGIGSMIGLSNVLGNSHNFFLEILLQFGVIIPSIIILFLLKTLLLAVKLKKSLLKGVLISSIVAFPFIGVINSMYLLEPFTWLFWGSLIIFIQYRSQRYRFLLSGDKLSI